MPRDRLRRESSLASVARCNAPPRNALVCTDKAVAGEPCRIHGDAMRCARLARRQARPPKPRPKPSLSSRCPPADNYRVMAIGPARRRVHSRRGDTSTSTAADVTTPRREGGCWTAERHPCRGTQARRVDRQGRSSAAHAPQAGMDGKADARPHLLRPPLRQPHTWRWVFHDGPTAPGNARSSDRAGPPLTSPRPLSASPPRMQPTSPPHLLPWLALALDIALLVPPVDRRRARGRGRSLGLASASGRGVQRSSPSRYLAQAVACIIGMLDAWARWGVR